MWARSERRSLVNLAYVTGIEMRIMESSISSTREPQWEIIAYRRPPGQDWILASMLDAERAGSLLNRIANALRGDQHLIDISELTEPQSSVRS